jgi:hypothetical protein
MLRQNREIIVFLFLLFQLFSCASPPSDSSSANNEIQKEKKGQQSEDEAMLLFVSPPFHHQLIPHAGTIVENMQPSSVTKAQEVWWSKKQKKRKGSWNLKVLARPKKEVLKM